MSKSRTNARISNKINGVSVVSTSPAAGQSLVYNGTNWVPSIPGGMSTLASPTATPTINSYINYTGSAWTYVTLAPVKLTAYSGIPSVVSPTTLTLTGSNFTRDLTALVNTTACTFNYVSATSATVIVPATTVDSLFLYLVQTNGQFAFLKIR